MPLNLIGMIVVFPFLPSFGLWAYIVIYPVYMVPTLALSLLVYTSHHRTRNAHKSRCRTLLYPRTCATPFGTWYTPRIHIHTTSFWQNVSHFNVVYTLSLSLSCNVMYVGPCSTCLFDTSRDLQVYIGMCNDAKSPIHSVTTI